jgi:RNA polymerase sigma-70 factor (ECF subfamily)
MNDSDSDKNPTRLSLLGRLRNLEDQESWREFFETYWKLIYTAAIKAGLTEVEAQDAVQETVISVMKGIREFRSGEGKASFKTWLLKLTSWRITDQLRKRLPIGKKEVRKADTATATGTTLDFIPEPEGRGIEAVWNAEWDQNLRNAAIERVKQKVDPQQYQIFDLYCCQDWPVLRVARALNINPARVYLAKHRVGTLIKKEFAKLLAKPI